MTNFTKVGNFSTEVINDRLQKTIIDNTDLIAYHYKNATDYYNEKETNDFINITRKIYDNLIKKYTILINNNDIEYEKLKKSFKDNIIIVADSNSNHQFLNKQNNAKFRATHDYFHYINNLDFSFESEIMNYLKSKKYYFFSENIYFNENIAQLCFLKIYGSFPKYQKVVNFNDILNLSNYEIN